MKLSIGSDHAGYIYKEAIKEMLIANGHDVHDVGTHSPERADYPDYAYLVATSVASGETQYGILVCGSGIGVYITANKVVCTGERLVSVELAKEIVTTFLASPFEGGRHTGRVEKIHQLTGC
jgi:ribose 5-phosphate isomerase B